MSRFTLRALLLTLIPALVLQEAAAQDERVDTLRSATVTAIREKTRNTTQTGLMRLDANRLRSGAVAFGTPDVIKQLQALPGVAAGNELMSGLYVHGGDGNDNLFLLDGVPLYNVSHFGGLFSSFNTDIIESLDFYKSGFPARYGGRMSSVVDVQTREGSLDGWHGGISIGLIDGRLQLEGPVIPGRTSINVALRRSWMDMITVPAIAYANRRNGDGQKVSGGYAMSDFNARLTHHFSPKSILDVSVYSGLDHLKAGLEQRETATDAGGAGHEGRNAMRLDVRWGSFTAVAAHRYTLSRQLKAENRLYYSRSHSETGYDFSFWSWQDGARTTGMNDTNRSFVREAGLKSDWDWYPDSFNHVRMGASVQRHWYGSGRDFTYEMTSEGKPADTDRDSESGTYRSLEPAVYAEDELFLAYNFTVNAGLRYAVFATRDKAWHSLEPRLSMKWLLSHDYAVKLSYTRMSQFAHLVAAMYMDLPSNSWMPSTAVARPMTSGQVAGGLYTTPWPGVRINLEGWYKKMDHLLVYNGSNSFVPPLTEWEKSFTEGTGRSWGMEAEAGWTGRTVELTAYYTLSWTRRNFEAFYDGWYPDRNDNRHKVNLILNWQIIPALSLQLNWNWHSGNRITFPSHIVKENGSETGRYVYDAPYNTKLPDYHRLDLSLDGHFKTRRGRSFGVNLSVYNAYNRKNASLALLTTDKDGNYSGLAYGLVPIIPTLSFNYRF